MKKKAVIICLLATSLFIAAFHSKTEPLWHTPAGWPQPVYVFKTNPLRKESIYLGRILFHDPILSRDYTISCASCHLPQTAFTHVDHSLSHGIEGRIGMRNSPALMNLAWSRYFMWDGAVNHLEVQPLAPISNHDEMDDNLAHVVEKLNQSKPYRSLFKAAYGDSLVTGQRTLKAISQFMLSLVSCTSKYDQVKAGKASFSPLEAQGYLLFKRSCSSCHTEPLFTNGGFENNGLALDTNLKDLGRMKITHRSSDSLKFKVPSLRNIEVSYPYMHDGRFRNLAMVLFHYSDGIIQSPTLSPVLKNKLPLNEADKNALIAFLKTLTDEAFLHNPEYGYHKTE